MANFTSVRLSLVTLAGVALLASCTADDPPEASVPPEQSTTAEQPIAESVETSETIVDDNSGTSSEDAADYLQTAWAGVAFDSRTEFCEGIEKSYGTGLVDRFVDQFRMLPPDVDNQVLFDFRDGECGEHAEAAQRDIDEALLAGHLADHSLPEEDLADLCNGLQVVGVETAAAAFREGFLDAQDVTDLDISKEFFEDYVADLCQEYEEERAADAEAANKDSEDWVRGSDDAWFTEAAVHSVWTNVDDATLERLCEPLDVLGVEHLAHSFASDVLEPVWSPDSPPIDIEAVEETLTDLCSS